MILVECGMHVDLCTPNVDDVSFTGRALLVKEEHDDWWWVYGVQPGGCAAFGDDKDDALEEFRIMLSEVVHDIYIDDPGSFSTKLHKFVSELCEYDNHRWYDEADGEKIIRVSYTFSCNKG